MKITDHLKNATKTLVSFELLPPLKGEGINNIFNTLDELIEFKPSFIDITYHREEYVYQKRENGLLERKSVRKRPGTVSICAAIMNKYQVDAVPHLICGGFSVDETENALIDLAFLGVDNVLALRGDPVKGMATFEPEPDGHAYALHMVEQINDMNNGQYLDQDQESSAATNFCVGIAGYPEKHSQAPNMATDLAYLKDKVDAGAEYIVTQLFYDVKKFFEFVDSCRAAGITIPIIPGLKPLTTAKQVTLLPQIFHIDIPTDLSNAVSNCKNNKDVTQVGVEWEIQMCKELIAGGAPCLHFYTMGKSGAVQRIARELF
ncbi:MAG: methylenetetrahydrofolate reductase [NAD(P)H] [Flavobacteriales bacterium]|nr:methylenetetrahydrofolate reductase [NAD(P)H] [Flavobacteriales bacterium]